MEEEKTYLVERIQEDDYGCEELPEGETPKVLCLLCAEDGTQRVVRAEDALLRERKIDAGSRVTVCGRELFPAQSTTASGCPQRST